MRSANCECDHEKQDHRRTAYGVRGGSGYGECKVCLCKGYTLVAAPDVTLGPNVSPTRIGKIQ